MKQGTAYAKLIKRLHHDLVKKHGKPPQREPMEPLQALLIGILAMDTPGAAKAHAMFQKLRERMVDLNEMRVTPVIELTAMIGNSLPNGEDKAGRIVMALNDVRRRQDTLDLSFLRQRGRREAREYLESLEGVTPYAAAFVVLFSLGGHAIPVDQLTVHILRQQKLVNEHADRVEVQSFLERNISAADAIEFAQLLSTYVGEHAARLSPKKLNEILATSAPAQAPVASKPAAQIAAPVAVRPVEPTPSPAAGKSASGAKAAPSGKSPAAPARKPDLSVKKKTKK